MQAVADDERVQVNTHEVWEFINEAGGMGMMGGMNMPHPIHLHGQQFQVLERRGAMLDGYVDEEALSKTREILTDAKRREEMVKHNYRIAKRYFSLAVLRRKLKNLIRETLHCEP